MRRTFQSSTIRARLALASLVSLAAGAASAAEPTYSWRYYRPGNTGIQGDYCDAIWIGPDNDPWIGGYDPGFEEGGLAKFIQSENRWINVSNVDYPEIGHPEDTGTTRVRDITPDAQGNLWMGTGTGVLRFNPSVGPSSLKRWGADNSPWPGGWVTNIEVAPDGTVWASGYATVWGFGGLMRYSPATGAWTYLGFNRPEALAVQSKPGGGYYLWATAPEGYVGESERYDSTTQSWTTFPQTSGNPRALGGGHAVDAAGNMWVDRMLPDNFNSVLDCRRPDGAWIGVPPPPSGSLGRIRAFAPQQCLGIDSAGAVWKFNGASWSNLGVWAPTMFSMDVDIDGTGAIWACGIGGAARRDPATGQWQRYRITNTSQSDSFNDDLTVNQATGQVWACANAGPGVGGMVAFDGTRWTGYNNLQYGLGQPWPFPTDNADAIYQRPSTGAVVVNPMFNSTHQLTGTTWTSLPGGSSDVVQYVEDSGGRLWQLGEYFHLSYWTGSAWNNVGIAAWGSQLRADPDRANTIWAHAGYEVVRTDGTYRFSRTIDHFPELTSQSDTIWGMAPAPGGIAWLGCSVMLGAGGAGGGLIKLNAETGAYSITTFEQGWPFPGKYVTPWAVTPDGRVWMSYTGEFQSFEGGGLCWYDPATGAVGDFPGPIPSGSPQWGGLPHAQIYDVEVRTLADGYELWMSCPSRGIAVLSVTNDNACYADCDASGTLTIDDFICFQTFFALGDPYADCDSDASLTIDDFICFQTFFALGC